jgi:Ser/Thr protein kinase RdoA (MazF antagonist)
MHKGADMVGDAPELMSSFESRFRKDVSNGVAMIHLIRLLRQRNHEPAAMDLLNKMLKDAAEYPMQVHSPLSTSSAAYRLCSFSHYSCPAMPCLWQPAI